MEWELPASPTCQLNLDSCDVRMDKAPVVNLLRWFEMLANRPDDQRLDVGRSCLTARPRGAAADVIVVYKVDRLTRSLADFAKLVELFDEHNVSFVSAGRSVWPPEKPPSSYLLLMADLRKQGMFARPRSSVQPACAWLRI
jgi:hypothetical protein